MEARRRARECVLGILRRLLNTASRVCCVWLGGKWEGGREDSTLQKARYFLREKMPEVPFFPVFGALHSLFALPHFFPSAS